jgi:hypothetical protein
MGTSSTDNNVLLNGDIEDQITTQSFDQLVNPNQAQDLELVEEIKVRNGGDNSRF